MAEKLFLIVRKDLVPEQQAVQAAHALRSWVEDCPQEDQRWFQESNTIALLSALDEGHLLVLLEKARYRGFPATGFREPDRNNELTAIALGPAAKSICRNLPLVSFK